MSATLGPKNHFFFKIAQKKKDLEIIENKHTFEYIYISIFVCLISLHLYLHVNPLTNSHCDQGHLIL